MLKPRKSFKKAVILGLCLTVTVAFSGCGSKNEPSATGSVQSSATETKAAPTEISILTDYYSKTAPDNNNPVQKEIERQSNTKLNITWIPNATYQDKLNVTLASGEIPDLTFVMNPHDPSIRTYYNQGMFYDLSGEYKNYKNLTAMPEAAWLNTKAPDGKNYIIPRPRPSDGGGFNLILRADLLESAGLAMPETTDELYNVLKTLTKSNPGFTGYVAVASVNQTSPSAEIDYLLYAFTKSNGLWKPVDGKLIFADLLPEMKDGLIYVSKLYSEKLINEDFAVAKDVKPILNSGKFIAMIGGSICDNWTYQKEAIKVDPKAKLRTTVSLNGVNFKTAGYFGGYGIYKKIPEDKMKKVMAFMDYMVSPEGGELCTNGIKGIHFTVENGVRKAIPEAMDKDNIGGNTYGQIGILFDKYSRAGTSLADIPSDLLDINKKLLDEKEKISIGSPIDMGLSSPTGDPVLNEYAKKSADLKLKIILGKEPMSSWDNYVAGLNADQTLKKIMDELTQSYLSKGGK